MVVDSEEESSDDEYLREDKCSEPSQNYSCGKFSNVIMSDDDDDDGGIYTVADIQLYNYLFLKSK